MYSATERKSYVEQSASICIFNSNRPWIRDVPHLLCQVVQSYDMWIWRYIVVVRGYDRDVGEFRSDGSKGALEITVIVFGSIKMGF